VVLAARLEEGDSLFQSTIRSIDAGNHPVNIGESNVVLTIPKQARCFAKLLQGTLVVPKNLLNVTGLEKNPPVEFGPDLRPRLTDWFENVECLLEKPFEL
jgi:hypothetical protein